MVAILSRRHPLDLSTESLGESLSELYHENSKLRPLPGAAPPSSYTLAELHAMARAHKRYRLHPQVSLPTVQDLPGNGVAFDEVVAARRTRRGFADADLGLGEVAKVLHQSYGITGELRVAGGGVLRLRAAPSAGALYPAEIYLGVRRVAGLAPGIYHYEVPKHALALLQAGDPTEQLCDVCCWLDQVREAAVVLLIAGVMQRAKRKYGERGYRYVLLDVGHLAQNLCLAGTALGLAVMTTCAFFDDAANQLLRLDGVDDTVLYVALLGKPGSVAASDLVSTTGLESVGADMAWERLSS